MREGREPRPALRGETPAGASRAIGISRVALLRLAVLLAVLSGACSPIQLGFPTIAVASRSPDGRYVASVRNHPSIDPPRQSLWLREEGARPVRLMRLGEDTDWCNTIAWSEDSSHVAFLIQDATVEIYEAATSWRVGSIRAVEPDGYPTSRAVRKLELAPDGGSLTVTICDRRGGGECETAVVAAKG